MWSGIWSVAITWIDFWTWIWSTRHCGQQQEVVCWFQCWENATGFVCWSNNIGSINVKMDGSVLNKKWSFKMLGLNFPSKLDLGSYIISNAKTASKKIGTLIRSLKFLSPKVALYLYKSNKFPCIEYRCHVWAGAPKCFLELLDKLKNEYAGLLDLHLLFLFNPWLIVEIWPA